MYTDIDNRATACQAHCEGIMGGPGFPRTEGGGSRGTLIVTRDEANGSIDSLQINELIDDLFDQ